MSTSAPAGVWSPALPAAEGFEHFVVETPRLRTHVAAIGHGEPVVMLHGFPQHWWQWRAVAPVVATAGYRVLCPDLRGAGWTVADDPAITRLARLADLLALYDALGIDRAHLVSHDMGAITAIQLSYAHPDRVGAAVQFSVPPGFMSFSPRIAPGFRHLPGFIWHRSGTSLAPIFGPAYAAHPMDEQTVAAHLAPQSRPEVEAAVRTLTRHLILPEALHLVGGSYRRQRLSVPTRFVFGEQDRPWTRANLGRICRRPERHADTVEFSWLEGASHFVTDDAPAAVAEVVLDWLVRHG